jgi:hypothetical protein
MPTRTTLIVGHCLPSCFGYRKAFRSLPLPLSLLQWKDQTELICASRSWNSVSTYRLEIILTWEILAVTLVLIVEWYTIQCKQVYCKYSTYYMALHVSALRGHLGQSSQAQQQNCWGSFLFLLCWASLRLIPLGTSVIIWPILLALDDRWVWRRWWNENWQGKPKYSEKACPATTLSTTNPKRHDLGSNTGCRSEKKGINRLNNGTICEKS